MAEHSTVTWGRDCTATVDSYHSLQVYAFVCSLKNTSTEGEPYNFTRNLFWKKEMFYVMVLKGRFLYVIWTRTCLTVRTLMIGLENGLERKKILYFPL